MHVFIILCYIKENENSFLAFVRLTVNAANNTIQYNTKVYWIKYTYTAL